MWIWIILSLLFLAITLVLYYGASMIEGEETFLVIAGIFLAVYLVVAIFAFRFLQFTPGKANLKSIWKNGPVKIERR